MADPAQLEKELPLALITDWCAYFHYKETRFDKLEYYLVQLSALIGGIVGVKSDDLIYDREGRGEYEVVAAEPPKTPRRRKTAAATPEPAAELPPRNEVKKASPGEVEKAFRLAFGV